MRCLIATTFLLLVSKVFSGSLLGHIRLTDDNGLQNPQIITIGFRSLTAEVVSQGSLKFTNGLLIKRLNPIFLLLSLQI